MPDIYKYFGFVFFFHSNEHDPIHVHVQHDHKESVFDIIMENGEVKDVRMREKKGVPPLTEHPALKVYELPLLNEGDEIISDVPLLDDGVV